jgi:hypothetical protein
MMEALSSSEPSYLTGARRRNIPEDGAFFCIKRFMELPKTEETGGRMKNERRKRKETKEGRRREGKMRKIKSKKKSKFPRRCCV